MINISKVDKDRCKSDVSFLVTILEVQLEKARDGLENAPHEKLPELQGIAKAYRDVINLLK